MSQTANTPKPPYYAVIFTSIRSDGDNGYAKMAEKMVALAGEQPGFLGMESAREDAGITVSYWKDLPSIENWKNHTAHMAARQKGKEIWYDSFQVRICRVERAYEFNRET